MRILIANLYTTHLTVPVGTLPLVLNSDVSPPGNHSVRVVANNSSSQSVPCIISSTDQPTGKLEDWNMYITQRDFVVYTSMRWKCRNEVQYTSKQNV